MSKSDIQTQVDVKLKPSQVYHAIKMADLAKDSLMIWGSPGIGKSQIAQSYADDKYPIPSRSQGRINTLKRSIEAMEKANDQETLGKLKADLATLEKSLLNQKSNFVDFRLSQVEPSDLRGIPIPVKFFTDALTGEFCFEHEMVEGRKYNERSSVVWAAPEALTLPADWKGVILFDEINSAMPIVQAAAYQLLLDRKIGELELPTNAVILAAGNLDTDGGVTFSLATPLRDRMTHVEMQADFTDWYENYALKNRVHPKVIGFLKDAERFFNTLGKDDPSHAGGSSPRSWVTVSDYEYQFDNMQEELPPAIYTAMMSGRLSNAIAGEYISYCKNVMGLPTVMDVMTGKVKDMGEHTAASKMYFMSMNLSYKILALKSAYEEGDLKKAEFNSYATNYITFLLNNYQDLYSELIILALRVLGDNDCFFNSKDVPIFSTLTQKYLPVLVKARGMTNRVK